MVIMVILHNHYLTIICRRQSEYCQIEPEENNNYCFSVLLTQGPVVRKVDNTIHWINRYPVDSVVCFVNTYPLDSDLSGG